MLSVSGLRVQYGQVQALAAIDLDVGEGDAVALLGANGAGKTTAVEAIVGLLPKKAGKVTFLGTDISQWTTDRVVRSGLVLVPQWRELFPTFSVKETLDLGRHAAGDRRPATLETIFDLFPILRERLNQQVSSLSGGEQQILTIARALMAAPRMMILDEPSAGLAIGIVRTLIGAINRIRLLGTSILLVEQNLEIATAIAGRCIVLSAGRQVWAGDLSQALDTRAVREAYFA